MRTQARVFRVCSVGDKEITCPKKRKWKNLTPVVGFRISAVLKSSPTPVSEPTALFTTPNRLSTRQVDGGNGCIGSPYQGIGRPSSRGRTQVPRVARTSPSTTRMLRALRGRQRLTQGRRELAALAKRVAALEEKQEMPKKLGFSSIEGHVEHAPRKSDFSSIEGHIQHTPPSKS